MRWISLPYLLLSFVCCFQSGAQTIPSPPSEAGIGDTLDHTPPLANLSPELRRPAVASAMRKVGDWEMARAQPRFSRDWTFAALYAGYMAAARALPERKYQAAMLDMANRFHWVPGPRKSLADDQAVAQTYLALYSIYREPHMIVPTEDQFNTLMAQPDDPAHPVWWWCDALFMAPPVWARLYGATNDIAYLNYMDREWRITSALLYDPQEHLFFRDATYLHKREANGEKLFWSRGNGWVMAGLARVLEEMPQDYPARAKYIDQFRQMTARIAGLQSADGLWRPGLLDPQAYPLPEVSGSSFFIYAIAWGINHHLLDRATYFPVVKKGWQGLLQHVYDDGRLGSIQPIGSAPDAYSATSSYVYGVGAFLLAGSEIMDLSKKK
ncbi:MAG TPA: glycoside hydrolase family 88 protein [Silvibacterium sp.]|nr:glycoside hydrolase family 88 protein [Silvibacterium sp.]